MKTLETLYRSLDDGKATPEYDSARYAKVAQIAEYLAAQGFKAPEFWAEYALSNAEEMGRIVGDRVTFEIPAHKTPNGQPLAATV